MRYFKYSRQAVMHLKSRDSVLAQAMDDIGHIKREVFPQLFPALVKSIVGQQISSKAQRTIWRRMGEGLVEITPHKVANCSLEKLQGYGITFKKAGYILNAAQCALDGRLDIEALPAMTDAQVCQELLRLDGVGMWTAEMLMLFSLERQDILSFGDLAILRGMRMLYHHRKITRQLFEKYRRRYSPYGSLASLYLWAIAGGAIEGMKDYAPTRRPQ